MDAALTPDQVCSRIAESQHGVITKKQALEAGLTPGQIEWRVSSGRWRALLPRVFAIGGAPATWHQALLAVCSWAGPLAAASYRAAANLWGLDGVFDRLVEISVPRKIWAPGVIIHRREVDPTRFRTREGIRLTDPTTTLINLAAVLTSFRMESALESGLRLRLTHLDLLWAMLNEVARSGRNGVRLMRKLLQERDPAMAPTASQLETLLSRLIGRFGLQRPERQYVITGDDGSFVARPDFAYPAARVAIEAQSYAHHHGRKDWERDQNRLSALTATGWLVLYVTNLQMKEHPELVARRIQQVLTRRWRTPHHSVPRTPK